MNWGAFLLDPLNLSGLQNEPQRRPPPAPAPPASAQPPPLSLDLSNPSPYGVTAGNEDGRPEKPQGFMQSMMVNENPFRPSWQFSQGKGPQWQSGSKGPFTGNRI